MEVWEGLGANEGGLATRSAVRLYGSSCRTWFWLMEIEIKLRRGGEVAGAREDARQQLLLLYDS